VRHFKVMISTRHRFHGYGSLKYVYRHGHTVRGPLFAVKSINNPKRKSYRLAVVVSKKVNKSAVARNRMRRRLYEGVRGMEEHIVQPADIILTVYNEAVLDEPWNNLNKQLQKQFKDAGVI
jgi:ribonuclease P protein component